jgi:Transglutaminase-like superfamily
MMADQPTSTVLPPLRRGVHAACCPDGIIFLDIPSDTYMSLYAPRSGQAAGTADLYAAISDAGLLAGSAATATRVPIGLESGWRELSGPTVTRPPIAFAARFALALGQALLRWHTRSFADLLAWASRPPVRRPVPPSHDAAQLVAWYEWLLLWLPVRPLCLFRSLLLLHVLRQHGLNARWVFGVSLFPFHAHCWLAIGDLLIGERADRAEEFTPIFATRMIPV